MPGRSKYPWETWCDGREHIAYYKQDYSISSYNFQISLHGRAKAKDLKVTTRSFTDRIADEHGILHVREGLRFQFWKKDAKS